MSFDQIYRYPPLYPGILLKRYKRFFANVELVTGEVATVLILDELTAGLDPVSEAQVLGRLLAHRQGKTTILINHRPRVINRADCSKKLFKQMLI